MLTAVAPKSCHSTTSETSAFLTCTLKTGPNTKSQRLPIVINNAVFHKS